MKFLSTTSLPQAHPFATLLHKAFGTQFTEVQEKNPRSEDQQGRHGALPPLPARFPAASWASQMAWFQHVFTQLSPPQNKVMVRFWRSYSAQEAASKPRVSDVW